MRLLWAAMVLAPLFCQTVVLSVQCTRSENSVDVSVSLESAADLRLTALQWELIAPAQLQTTAWSSEPGGAPKADGKSLHCASHAGDQPGVTKQVCVLVGGQKPLASGQVAKFHFPIPKGTKPGRYKIEIRHARGVTHNLKEVAISGTSDELTVP